MRMRQKEEFGEQRIQEFDDLLQASCLGLRELRQQRESRPSYDTADCPFCDEHNDPSPTRRDSGDFNGELKATVNTTTRSRKTQRKLSKAAIEQRRHQKQTAWLSRRLGSNYGVLEQTQQLELEPAATAPLATSFPAKGLIEVEKDRFDWMGTRSACNMKALVRESTRIRRHA